MGWWQENCAARRSGSEQVRKEAEADLDREIIHILVIVLVALVVIAGGGL